MIVLVGKFFLKGLQTEHCQSKDSKIKKGNGRRSAKNKVGVIRNCYIVS